MRTVQELEHAGVSGLSIEDTALPIPFGQADGENRLISIEEGVGKGTSFSLIALVAGEVQLQFSSPLPLAGM